MTVSTELFCKDFWRPSPYGYKRFPKVVDAMKRIKPLRGQLGPEPPSDQAVGTEGLPPVLETSKPRVTCQIATRQHRELVQCLGTR